LALQPVIEFTSGSLLTIRFEQTVSMDDLKSEVAALGYPTAIVQSTGSGDFQIRTSTLDDASKEGLETGLSARFGDLSASGFINIAPTISR
jgi:preprotein translocase subunit SecF